MLASDPFNSRQGRLRRYGMNARAGNIELNRIGAGVCVYFLYGGAQRTLTGAVIAKCRHRDYYRTYRQSN